MKKCIAMGLPVIMTVFGGLVYASDAVHLIPSSEKMMQFYTPKECKGCKPVKMNIPMQSLFVHDDIDRNKRQLFAIPAVPSNTQKRVKALFYNLVYDGRFLFKSNVLATGNPKTLEMTDAYLIAVQKKGTGIMISNFLDDYAPKKSSMYNTLRDYKVHNLDPVDNFLFLATDKKGLVIADIRDRNDIWISGSYPFENPLIDVDVVNDTAYVLVEKQGLSIIDVSKGEAPQKLGDFTFIEGTMKKIDVYEGMAFILTTHKLYVVDISEPKKSTLLASYEDKEGEFKTIKRSGRYLFVVSTKKIEVIDTSKKETLSIVGKVPTPADKQVCDIAFNNPAKSAYVAFCDAPIKQYVLTEAYSKILEKKSEEQQQTVTARKSLEQLYKALYISKNEPFGPRVKRSSKKVTKLIGFNDAFLLGFYERELRLYSLENPDKPYRKGFEKVGYTSGVTSSTDSSVLDTVKLIDGEVYVTSSELGYTLMLYSIKGNAFVLESRVKGFKGEGVSLTVVPINFAKKGDLLFVASKENGLLIADFSKKDKASLANLPVLGKFGMEISPGKDVHKTLAETTNIALSKDKAYITVLNKGLVILNVSDPKKPTKLALYPFKGRGTKVLVEDNFAYVITPREFFILNVTDHNKIQKVFSYMSAYATLRDIKIGSDKKVYLSAGMEGLKVIDISNKEKPKMVAEIAMEDGRKICSAVVKDGQVYLAHCRQGLSVYSIKNPINTKNK